MKNLIKNWYIFLKLLRSNQWFLLDLRSLLLKWNPEYRAKKSLGHFARYQKYADLKKKNAEAYKIRMLFIEKLSEEKRVVEFMGDIENFLQRFDLGKEWVNSIADFIICGWFHPPTFNLYISEDDQSKNKQRVVLTLNPDTSLKDVKEAWRTIKAAQKKLHPLFKKTNLTKKSFTNLDIAWEDVKTRFLKDANEFNEVESIEYRRRDIDIVGQIWNSEEDMSTKADQRRKANLRKIRQRFKK